MKLYIPIKTINAEINLPASKSISNRALIINALSQKSQPPSPSGLPPQGEEKGKDFIQNLSDSDDTQVLQRALTSDDTHFDIGASGTAMRFLTAFLAQKPGGWTITGSERMKQRPIKILVDALNTLGAKIEYLEKDGFPPLKIIGNQLAGGEISLNGGVSSQYVSALMMIAPYMERGLKMRLEGEIVSKPYIEMTLKMMREFGANASFSENTIDIKPVHYKPAAFRVEPDWSSASYWYAIMAVAGSEKIFLPGLRKNSLQGDSKLTELFDYLEIKTECCDAGVTICSEYRSTSVPLKELRYNFVNEPDLVQTFAVICCLKSIPFEFSGLQSLKIKETDRISALITELRKFGYVLREFPENTLIWNGERCQAQENPSVATYDDHRMAMAFAPIALTQTIEIQHPEVVTKSYPKFWEDLDRIKSQEPRTKTFDSE